MDDYSNTSSSDEDEEDNPPEEKNKTGSNLYQLITETAFLYEELLCYNFHVLASCLGKKVKQRASKLSAVQMLSDKYERKAELKQKSQKLEKWSQTCKNENLRKRQKKGKCVSRRKWKKEG